MKFYDFTAKKMNGIEVKMDEYKGKVLLVVNTASKCGFTPQLAELEQMYKAVSDTHLDVYKRQILNNNQIIVEENKDIDIDKFKYLSVNVKIKAPYILVKNVKISTSGLEEMCIRDRKKTVMCGKIVMIQILECI